MNLSKGNFSIAIEKDRKKTKRYAKIATIIYLFFVSFSIYDGSC